LGLVGDELGAPWKCNQEGRGFKARKSAFDTAVIEDACRGIDLNGSLAASWTSMTAAGVHRIRSADLGIFS
jgi:hypothetical protein